MPKRFNHHRQEQSPRGGAMAALLMLLLPIFFPSLFTPLTHASPSISSEWNSIKPRHTHLLKSALQREIPFQQKLELWTPLPHQGWKPCSDLGLKPILPEKSEGYIQVFLDKRIKSAENGGL